MSIFQVSAADGSALDAAAWSTPIALSYREVRRQVALARSFAATGVDRRHRGAPPRSVRPRHRADGRETAAYLPLDTSYPGVLRIWCKTPDLASSSRREICKRFEQLGASLVYDLLLETSKEDGSTGVTAQAPTMLCHLHLRLDWPP
jgi:hypothetical protein